MTTPTNEQGQQIFTDVPLYWTQVDLEGTVDEPVEAWTMHLVPTLENWNYFATPLFTREGADEVIRQFNHNCCRPPAAFAHTAAYYDAANDRYVTPYDEYPPDNWDYWNGAVYLVRGVPTTLYAIGTWSWTWTNAYHTCEPSDATV